MLCKFHWLPSNNPLHEYCNLLIHSPIDEYLDVSSLGLLQIKLLLNICVQVFLWTFLFDF